VYASPAPTLSALAWKFKTGGRVLSSPLVVGDAVYVAAGLVYIGSWDRNLYALDAATGRERWRYTTGNDTTIYNQIGIASSAAVANGVVFVGGRDGQFHAVDARTGALKWKHDNRMGWTIASPAVRDGVVYFPTSDGRRFKALDAATGAVLARFQTDGSKEHGPRLLDENGLIRTSLLYPDRTLDGMMIGMRTIMTLGSVLSSPAVVDGIVYFGSTDGHLYAVR
jgi:outer membrane protein assembly factor BamB